MWSLDGTCQESGVDVVCLDQLLTSGLVRLVPAQHYLVCTTLQTDDWPTAALHHCRPATTPISLSLVS